MMRRGSVGSATLALVFALALALAGGCDGDGGTSGGGGGGDATAEDGGGGGGDDVVDTAQPPDGTTCEPSCDGRACGDDGCGGSCGTCDAGFTCDAGQCVGCTADCAGKACGDDGCGGSCGTCDAGFSCDAGQCVEDCVPDCADKACGDDGCGGSCGTCDAGFRCDEGACVEDVCEPDCSGGPCSDDGCGGVCEGCAEGEACSMTDECAVLMSCAEYSDCVNACEGDATCEAGCDSRTSFEAWDAYGTVINCIIDNCAGLPSEEQFNQCIYTTCGDDYYACFSGPENCGWLWGCINNCEPLPECFGDCLVHGTREAQDEVVAVVNCIGDACGAEVEVGDACWDEAVVGDGACADIGAACSETCTPDCAGKECGDSGCGYDCGPCEPGFVCSDAFVCETCEVECGDAVCGPSNCPGVPCGECAAGSVCEDGACVELVACAPEDATVIGCDEIVSANTSTGTNLFGEYACTDWDESGPELLYSFTAAADEEVYIAFSDLQAGVDLDLFVMDSTCTAESCLAVGDNDLPLEVTAGETYYIAVDGYNGASGTFSLALDCPSACEDPACGERQCGPAPGALCAGYECGTCPDGQTCTAEGTCIDDPCGGLDEIGCCAGDVVVWCENLTIQTLDCQTDVDEPTTCGWWEEQGFFACGPDDPPPADVEPECSFDCETATCESAGVECGLLPACPLTDCGACDSGFQCVFGVCEEVECDIQGFEAASAQTTYDENRGRYYGLSADTQPYDAFIVELWWNFGAPSEPGTYEILDQNYSECGLCVLGNTGCTEAGCETTYLAFSGTFELTDVPTAMGETFGGTVSNVQMREVTINQSAVSTPVPGGGIWCINGFSFQLATAIGK